MLFFIVDANDCITHRDYIYIYDLYLTSIFVYFCILSLSDVSILLWIFAFWGSGGGAAYNCSDTLFAITTHAHTEIDIMVYASLKPCTNVNRNINSPLIWLFKYLH